MTPIVTLLVVVSSVGYLPHFCMKASLLRVFTTTICCECVMVPLLWLVVLEKTEREFVATRIRKVLHIG